MPVKKLFPASKKMRRVIVKFIDIMLENPKVATDEECLSRLFAAAARSSTPKHPIKIISDEHMRKIPPRTLFNLCDRYINDDGTLPSGLHFNFEIAKQVLTPFLVAYPNAATMPPVQKLLLAERVANGTSAYKKLVDRWSLRFPAVGKKWLMDAVGRLKGVPDRLLGRAFFFILDFSYQKHPWELERDYGDLAEELEKLDKDGGKENK